MSHRLSLRSRSSLDGKGSHLSLLKRDEELDDSLKLQCNRFKAMSLTRFGLVLVGIGAAMTLSHKMMNRQLQVLMSRKKIFASSFHCPLRDLKMPENYDEDTLTEYIAGTKNNTEHFEDFIRHYRERESDLWLKTYEEVMEKMMPFKAKYFPTNIKSGETMYESACGIGMNLIMTLEILQQHGIQDIQVFGNDFVENSVDLAQNVVKRLAPSFGGNMGSICQADSTDLKHIPSDSFDLVYTGYLPILYDPFNLNLTYDESKGLVKRICKTYEHDYKSRMLLDIAIQRQNEWHHKWVSEMIRIAKPGKAIILEQVRDTKCEKAPNAFGQSRDWWYKAIHEYGWDVDPKSIEMQDDLVFSKRYNLFMRKNEKESLPTEM